MQGLPREPLHKFLREVLMHQFLREARRICNCQRFPQLKFTSTSNLLETKRLVLFSFLVTQDVLHDLLIGLNLTMLI